jgi:hypothetical protein
MSLFSICYRTNQYRRRVYQFETKLSAELPKPIYLKALTLVSEQVWQAVRTKFENVKLDFQGSFGSLQSHLERLP